MITEILLMKEQLNQLSSKEDKFKSYYKTSLEPFFEYLTKEHFIFKYEELLELYKVIDNYNIEDSKLFIIDDNYHMYTIKFNNDIISIRIDISTSSNLVEVKIENNTLESIDYSFFGKLKYSDYDENTKERDSIAINICNNLIMHEYVKILYYIYWDKPMEPKFNDIIHYVYKYNLTEEEKPEQIIEEKKGWFKRLCLFKK